MNKYDCLPGAYPSKKKKKMLSKCKSPYHVEESGVEDIVRYGTHDEDD